jgi:hypothetical protein
MNKLFRNGSSPKNEADHFLADARKSFWLASGTVSAEEIERYAKMGREYLQLAHKAAELNISHPSLWPMAGGSDG